MTEQETPTGVQDAPETDPEAPAGTGGQGGDPVPPPDEPEGTFDRAYVERLRLPNSIQRVIPNAPPATRRRWSYISLIGILGVVALLPSRAEGRTSAYVTFVVTFVLTALIVGLAEKRWRLTSYDLPVRPWLTTIVGSSLIISYAGPPTFKAAGMGVICGALFGLAGMVLVREGFRARPGERHPQSDSGA